MNVVVLALAAIQAAVGIVLLTRWWRTGRHSPAPVIVHVAVNATAILLWVAFMGVDVLALAWISFVLLNVGNAYGDAMMIARARRDNGASERFLLGYRNALAAVFQGRMPGHVVFHAIFSGVVYFTMLAACIVASAA